jgi:hypothetical protein
MKIAHSETKAEQVREIVSGARSCERKNDIFGADDESALQPYSSTASQLAAEIMQWAPFGAGFLWGVESRVPRGLGSNSRHRRRRYERHWTPVHVDFHVDDFEKVLERVLSAGAKCEQRFDGGEHSPIAFCSDPFGNGFCVIGKRPSA